MVDSDIRIRSNAHSAGLKRLSARAHAAGVAGGPPSGTGGRRVFFSFAAYARTAIEYLINCRVPIEKGLSDEEFARVEASYGFTFPPDLRAILHEGLPVGDGFPNWRHGSSQQLQMRLDLPTSGLLYEVARSNMWWKQWGPRPVDIEQAVRLARAALRKVPLLVPVYSHCYIPSSPNLAGNPVFFVYLKDVFISGIDIADFFQRDQFTPHDYEPPTNLPDFMEWVGGGGTDSGSRGVMRMGSGRDLFLKDRISRLIDGKENLTVTTTTKTGGRMAGDDENQINVTSAQEAPQQQQHHHESNVVVPAWRLSDARDHALMENTGGEEAEKVGDDAVDRDFESWGRSLDTLVAKHSEVLLFKSLDNFGRPPSSRSLDYNNSSKSQQHQRRSIGSRPVAATGRPVAKNRCDQDIASKFSYFEETPLSSKALMHFSINAPPWAAKAARFIEFWSELMEKRPMTNVLTSDTLFSAHNVDCDVANNSNEWGKWETTPSKESLTKFKSSFLPKWMVSYLDDICLRLRKGGWNEDDIEEIMETCPGPRLLPEMYDKQSVLDALSRQAQILSSSLRQAGWSIRDVAEVLNVDLSFGDHKLTTSKLSPELAARLSTFAEYVVNA
ncbi:unnamed protein product [Calypogeia fissa]